MSASYDRMTTWKPQSSTTGPENAPPASSGKSTTSTSNVLKLGSTGSLVKEVQQKLGIPVDGVFGTQTQNAVKAFQKSRGLVVDGIVGAATLSALRQTGSFSIAGTPKATGSVNAGSSMTPILLVGGALLVAWLLMKGK